MGCLTLQLLDFVLHTLPFKSLGWLRNVLVFFVLLNNIKIIRNTVDIVNVVNYYCSCKGLIYYYWFILPIYPQFRGIQLVVSLVSSLQLPYGLWRGGGLELCVLWNTTPPHCFLTQCPHNPETSPTNVSEETLYAWRPTLGQLCAASWVSRSWPAATEPGLEPRISSGTAKHYNAVP
jgi:hypothetical protein